MRPYFVIRLIPFFFLSCILLKSSAGADQLPFQTLQSGIEWFEGTVQANKESFTLRVVRADISQYSLQIVAEDPIVSGHTVLEYQKLSNAHVVLSGGFLKSYYPPLPLGLVKSNGKILNRPSLDPFFSGLFCSREGELAIERYAGKEQTTPWDHCLQSGPLLVYEGRSALEVGHYPREFVYKAFNRAFVAIDQQGHALLAVTGKVTLPSLISLLQRPAQHGGLGCRAALNLSGVSVGMVVEVTGRFLTAGDIEVYPPNAIILKSGKQKGFTNSIGMEFVSIQPGTFMMGSPSDESGRFDNERQHRVTLSKGFLMQTTEVTQSQWQSVMGTRPWSGKKYVRDSANNPAVYISWNDCQDFIRRLSQKEGTNKYQLPTEAQWEYACRAGSTARFYFGESDSILGDYAWYRNNAWDVGEKYAHTVAQKQPNSWGLYDTHGNVWEWCQDWYEKNYPTGHITDPKGPSSGNFRVFRGSSWFRDARYCRSADRFSDIPDLRSSLHGFRVARAL